MTFQQPGLSLLLRLFSWPSSTHRATIPQFHRAFQSSETHQASSVGSIDILPQPILEENRKTLWEILAFVHARPIEFSKVEPIKQENSAGNPCQSRWSEIISGPGGKGKKFRVQLSAEWIFRIKHQTWRLSLFQRALTCSRHELYIHITCTLKLKFKTWIPFTSWIVFKNRFEIFLRMLARRIEFSEVKILFRISK